MTKERDHPRDGISVPKDNENALFELWKDGRCIEKYPNLDDAKADCEAGNRQHKGYAVLKDAIQIWPVR